MNRKFSEYMKVPNKPVRKLLNFTSNQEKAN